MKDFIEKLHSYNLFTFQSRIYNKLLMFAHSIKTNGRAPVDIRPQINLPAPEDDLEKKVEKTVNVYNPRRGRTLVKNIIPETKNETLAFKIFFPRLLSFYNHLDFSVRKYYFILFYFHIFIFPCLFSINDTIRHWKAFGTYNVSVLTWIVVKQ